MHRRSFLGTSCAAMATALVARRYARGAEPTKYANDPTFQPATLFLTWQRDPTTTMTVQWVGVTGETPDTKVYYRPAVTTLSTPLAAGVGLQLAMSAGMWAVEPTTPKPYPMSFFKVFRAE